jgi:ABC-2 type transport system ATP-binding protein
MTNAGDEGIKEPVLYDPGPCTGATRGEPAVTTPPAGQARDTDVLSIGHLTKTFGDKIVLDDICFTVGRGDVFGLLGPNGAGKTTLIRTILDIFRPDAGTITLFGRTFSDDIKNAIGYLPEEGSLEKETGVAECIRYFARLKHTDSIDAKADAWLARLALTDYKDRKVQELSKGMHRRLQFILAVIHEPAVLILDEPFSGLDPLNIKLLKDILLELRARGTTIIMSTHQMDEVERMCDRILMLNAGRVVLYGRLDEIRRQFGLSVEIRYEGRLPALDNILGISDSGNSAELVVAKDTDTQALLRTLAAHVVINKFEIRQRSMNEIFLEVCRK